MNKTWSISEYLVLEALQAYVIINYHIQALKIYHFRIVILERIYETIILRMNQKTSNYPST